jgi:large subunit ribosomal protein L18
VLKNVTDIRKQKKQRVRQRIRKKLRGTTERPRVYVFKSNRYLYTQVVDDATGRVLAAASSLEKAFKDKNSKFKNRGASEALGTLLAERLKAKKITRVVFDRGVHPYHGGIKALAEAMRKGGLAF